MGRPRKNQLGRSSVVNGSERVWWAGRWHVLGPAGSQEARANYARLAALVAADPAAPGLLRAGELTVSRLCREYLESPDAPAEERQLDQCRRAVGLLLGHHLTTAAADLGPVALAAWQRWLCDQADEGDAGRRRWNRTYVGHLVGWVRRIYKWGVRTERVAEPLYRALCTVPGPKFGAVRESEGVPPADPAAVAKTLPYLRPQVRAMVLIQMRTGARPGEVCGMRPAGVHRSGKVVIPGTGRAPFDIDAEGVWVYLPEKHKGTSRRKPRALYLGPAEQAVLRPYLDRPAGSPCFSPKEAVDGLRAGQRAARTKAGGGSGGSRKKATPDPARAPGRAYTPKAYYHAVLRACAKAGVEPWYPYQLRHLAAEEIDGAFGLDAAQAVLGHADPKMTAHYAKGRAAAKRAADVARKRSADG